MKTRTLGWLVGLSAVASSFLSCTQAKVACVVGHAGSGVAYIAQYFAPTDSPAGCGMKSQLQVQSLIWQSRYNASQNADPAKDDCAEDADGNIVLASDMMSPCVKLCAADSECKSTHCAATSCKDDTDCVAKTCVLSDPLDPMSPKVCEQKTCDVGDVPTIEVLSSLTGDQVGMETYHPPKDVGDEKQPDFSIATVAIQTDSTGNLSSWSGAAGLPEADPDNDKAYAIGKFTSAEPVNDFCAVQDIKPSVQKFPGIDTEAMPPEQVAPEQDFTNEWRDVKFYVTAAAQGTQFSGDLVYTQVDHSDLASGMDTVSTCTVTYHVRGIWPAVPCWVPDPSEDPRYAGQPQEDPAKPGHLIVDQAQCCADADPPARPVGSGINPDFPVKCDDILGYCVLDAPADAKLPLISGNKNPACKTAM